MQNIIASADAIAIRWSLGRQDQPESPLAWQASPRVRTAPHRSTKRVRSLARSRLAWVEGVVTFNLKRAERLRQSMLRKGFSGRF